MKLVKSLLLGSAAGLAAVVSAQAADLPVRKAAPVEYVRVCSTYGAGFFYIPGTETCLRIGGRVRADFGYREPVTRLDNVTGFHARGRLNVDTRTATAYGLLRAYIRYDLIRNTGPFGSDSAGLSQAFVQFGGLTAGRVTSFFANGDLPTGHMGTLRFDDAPDVNTFAYTFAFGNGFSASIGIEDGISRRTTGFIAGGGNALDLVYAGQRLPNVVGNVKYVGTWGNIQLSGAATQLSSANLFPVGGGLVNIPDTEYGWAAQLSGAFNLPMLAPGDALWFAATYANGALSYLGFGSTLGIGVLAAGIDDAYINAITGDIERGEGWSIAGGLRHYWTPQIRSNVFGSYARVEYGRGAATLLPTGVYAGLNDFNEWRVGANVFWQPVSGLDLGVEVMYSNLDPRGRVLLPSGQLVSSDSSWEGRIRVQRDF
ncbi:porin [Microvirga lenta]|uniref:porin n=1 Tax=Microvirga lenta TaxID=2881337 RepID=UPI001CFFADB5|nr:porin [Microvirga lenta]MCB5176123.1 porin [Microvirga lenta]